MASKKKEAATSPTVTFELGGNKMSHQPPEREFSSGSRGFYVGGKLQNPEDGKTYQISCNIVEIGSKQDKS